MSGCSKDAGLFDCARQVAGVGRGTAVWSILLGHDHRHSRTIGSPHVRCRVRLDTPDLAAADEFAWACYPLGGARGRSVGGCTRVPALAANLASFPAVS